MIKFKEIALVLIFITSCSNIPLPLYEYGYEAFKEGYFNLDSKEIDEDYFKDQKFDSIKVRFGSSRSIVMVLLSSNNGIKEWISSDKIRIYTFNGKIVKVMLREVMQALNISSNMDWLNTTIPAKRAALRDKLKEKGFTNINISKL